MICFGISRDAGVIAYQTGAGLMDLITPTNGAVLAMLLAAGRALRPLDQVRGARRAARLDRGCRRNRFCAIAIHDVRTILVCGPRTDRIVTGRQVCGSPVDPHRRDAPISRLARSSQTRNDDGLV